MAKSANRKVAVKSSAFDSVELDARITTDDLIAIRISEIENSSTLERQALEAELKTAKAKLKQAEKDRMDNMQAKAEKAAKAQLAVTLPGFDIRAGWSWGPNDTIVPIVSVSEAGCKFGTTINLPPVNAKPPAALARLETEISELQDSILEIVNRLSNIPQFERTIRAELAKCKLEKSGGAELISTIRSVALIGA